MSIASTLVAPSPSAAPAAPVSAPRRPRPCRAARRAGLGALALAALLAPAPARAETLPLSALPEKPARYAAAEGDLHVEVTGYAVSSQSSDVTADGRACLLSSPPPYWIDGDASIDSRYTSFSYDSGSTFGVERLLERGGGAELERIAIHTARRYLKPTGRSRIPLRAVAQLDGVTVYAYRWASRVFLIARSITRNAFVRTDGLDTLRSGSDCDVLYTMLQVRSGSSEIAQIRGEIPRTGKPYVVNASISQSARDPEPLLSITARLLEP